MGTYERRAIRTRVHLSVLSNVPIGHPRAHDAKRNQLEVRSSDDREHVRMSVELVLFDHAMVYLVLGN